jgi:hypothetical protein
MLKHPNQWRSKPIVDFNRYQPQQRHSLLHIQPPQQHQDHDMIGINHHRTLVTDQDQEETQSTANPTGAHNHNLRAGTTPVNKHHSTISQLILNKEAEHRQENDLPISKHIPMINLHTNKTEHHQVTHVGMMTNNVNATNGGAEKKSKGLTNSTKKKVVEEQNTRKWKKKENATKNEDVKCNDAPTA